MSVPMAIDGQPFRVLARLGKACAHAFWSLVFVLAAWWAGDRYFGDDD